jgi:SNARE associated Golgi protein
MGLDLHSVFPSIAWILIVCYFGWLCVRVPKWVSIVTGFHLKHSLLTTHSWFIVASSTILGSTAAFIVSRNLLHSYVTRLVAGDSRFTALALTLKHDGIKLLIMIRLCPLPYSLSNGALSTIPTVHWSSFMLATALVSPKLLLHVFIGAQWAKLADKGNKMDAKTRALSYLSIAIGMFFGIATGYIIYGQTKKRARELEELERAEGGVLRDEYEDDPDLVESEGWLREETDDISLRDAWGDEDDYMDADDGDPARGSVSPKEDEEAAPGGSTSNLL